MKRRYDFRANTHTECHRQRPMMSSHACPHNACRWLIIGLCSVHLGHMPSNLINNLQSHRPNDAANIINLLRPTMNCVHFPNESVPENHRRILRSLAEHLAVQNLGHFKRCKRLFMIVRISMRVVQEATTTVKNTDCWQESTGFQKPY